MPLLLTVIGHSSKIDCVARPGLGLPHPGDPGVPARRGKTQKDDVH